MKPSTDSTSLLTDFIEGPVVQNDPVLRQLIEGMDKLEETALIVHDFIHRTSEYIGLHYELTTGYKLKEFLDGGIQFMASIMDPEDLPRLAMLQASYVQQAKQLDFDPRTVVIQEPRWTIIHRNGSKVPVFAQGAVLTYTLQGDFEVGIGLFSHSNESMEKKIQVYTSLLQKVKERHNEIYLHPIREELVSPYPLHFIADFSKITLRERDVLGMLAKGKSTTEIGEFLGISDNTVESHRRKLLEKFDAKNSPELIKKASKIFWLE